MNCVNCCGKPYAEYVMGLPYCKNCVAGHDAFARRTLVGGVPMTQPQPLRGRDPQERSRVQQYTHGQRVTADDGVGGIGVERVRALRKKFERAEGKRKKEETKAYHEKHPETKEDEMEQYMEEMKARKKADEDFYN